MPDYLLMLEQRLQDVLETHGLEDIAMLLFHNGMTTCAHLIEMRRNDEHEWQIFVGKIRVQYHLLGRRNMQYLDRLVENAFREAAREGPVSASMVMPPPGTVVTEPTGQSM